ncbi:MAG: FMN reductase [Actinobacteria bacterium]|nr:FMN reductase [Actinomycetota bacterium]
MSRSIVVISAGLANPSSTRLLADQLATATDVALRSHGEAADVHVIELRELAHPLADHLLTGFPTGELAQAIEMVRKADGLVVVTPVFAASYSGLFKMFFEVLDKDLLRGKPVLLGATAGTARHSLVLEHAMRPLFSYLGAVTVPTAVFAATEDFGRAGSGDFAARIATAGRELAALVLGAPRVVPQDPFDNVTPFDQLLKG